MPMQIFFISSRIKTWYIFERNFQDLCIACDEFTNPKNTFESGSIRLTMSFDANLEKQEIERKFHNFLAAAKTLVDHTRLLMNEYGIYDTEGDFKSKVELLESASVVKFCHDLRNYFLHIENPIDNLLLAGTWSEAENHILYKGYVRVSKKSLLLYKKWTTESKKYIEIAGDEIELKCLAEEYYNEVSDINDWLNNVFPKYIPRTPKI